MKSLKGRGGVIGRGMSENILRVWTKTIRKCAEVIRAISFVFPLSTMMSKKSENEDLNEINECFKVHNPFAYGKKLLKIFTGKK